MKSWKQGGQLGGYLSLFHSGWITVGPTGTAVGSLDVIWMRGSRPHGGVGHSQVAGGAEERKGLGRFPGGLKEVSPGVHWRDWRWSWDSSTLATSCEELTHWKRPWCWGGLEAGGEGDDRGWDGWMASLIRWTWVWVNSRSCWWTGRPGVLRFMGSQRVGHDWATELNWTEPGSRLIGMRCCHLLRLRLPKKDEFRRQDQYRLNRLLEKLP